jgi:hypothetical protein
MVKASVVILARDSAERLVSCLGSLWRELSEGRYEVIVVDNGSRDLTPAVFRHRLARLRLVINRRNRGVAPARNQGIAVAHGDYLVLLDDDTVVRPGALEHLLALMDERPRVAVCGPKLVDAEGRTQLSWGLFPTLTDKLARWLAAAPAVRGQTTAKGGGSVREVDYVIGACQVIRRAALTEVGLLDERIFYGPEDVDLCLRVRRAGWRVVYDPEAVVVHDERRAGRSLFTLMGWRHAAGLVYYFWKHGYLLSRRRLYSRLPG